MHFPQKKERTNIQDDNLCRQNYNDLSEVSLLLVLLPEQLPEVLLQSLHRTAGKHSGISKMMQ